MVVEKYVWARIKGLPLNLWSRKSLESIMSMVEMIVEIDKSILEMEELKYARVLIKMLVAREVRWANCMKINEIVCQIAIEEEPIIKHKSCCNHVWENSSKDEQDDELESNLGGVF